MAPLLPRLAVHAVLTSLAMRARYRGEVFIAAYIQRFTPTEPALNPYQAGSGVSYAGAGSRSGHRGRTWHGAEAPSDSKAAANLGAIFQTAFDSALVDRGDDIPHPLNAAGVQTTMAETKTVLSR